MHSIEQIVHALVTYLTATYSLTNDQQRLITCSLNVDESKKSFGDLNSNAALVLAKIINKSPREIAQQIAQGFTHPHLTKIEIAGPGFLNFFLTPEAYRTIAHELYTQGTAFFKPPVTPHTICLEFVSANPTGPLHFGHGRGGIIGDVLGNVLRFAGHRVTKEFYINDAGSQIKKLGLSLKIRCQQLLGQNIALPEDAYHGDYLIDLGKKCIEEHGTEVVEQPDTFFGTYAKEHLLAHLQKTLRNYGIAFDVWFSEKTLHSDGSIERAINQLQESGHLYEKEGALWFTSTKFGDDKDRVLRKTSGELTYAASDVAYTDNKFKRGHDRLIFVLGQDHHSYLVRLKGIAQAMGYNPDHVSIILYQLVSIKESGELVRMSKRTGKLVTLEDVIETVGKDVARFFYLHRKADAHLEFDIDLALKRTEENPTFYLQYAYVRTGSLLDKGNELPELRAITVKDLEHSGVEEQELLKKILALKDVLSHIEHTYQTHLLSYYALELAQTLHRYYAHTRIIDTANLPQSRARLATIHLLRITLGLILDLLGLEKPERM